MLKLGNRKCNSSMYNDEYFSQIKSNINKKLIPFFFFFYSDPKTTLK